MCRLLLAVCCCGGPVAPVFAAAPSSYGFEPGLSATYDFVVEVQDGDRVILWKGSPSYTVEAVEGAAAVIRYEGSFDATARLRNAPAGLAPFVPGTSRSSASSSLRATARGEVVGAVGSPELPLPLGPLPAVPFVVLPEAAADRWETTAEAELGLRSMLFRPQPAANGFGPRPPLFPFEPQGRGALAYEERLHLTEKVTYAAKPDTGEFERTCTIRSAEQIGEKPRIEFNSTGTVAFAEDGFLPARVEWSGAFTLRTGSGELTSPVSVSARRLTADELAERAAAAEQAQLEAAAKLRDDLGQLVADLKSGDELKARAAAGRLDSDLADGNDPVVAAALHGALRAADGPWRGDLGRALIRWATPEQAEMVIELLDDRDPRTRRAAIAWLSDRRVERAIPAIANRLVDNFDRAGTTEALKKFGAAAEPAVIELLGHKDWPAKQQAIEVLKTIGTGKSLGPLRKAAEDKNPIVKRSAEAAIKAIEERVNAPMA